MSLVGKRRRWRHNLRQPPCLPPSYTHPPTHPSTPPSLPPSVTPSLDAVWLVDNTKPDSHFSLEMPRAPWSFFLPRGGQAFRGGWSLMEGGREGGSEVGREGGRDGHSPLLVL